MDEIDYAANEIQAKNEKLVVREKCVPTDFHAALSAHAVLFRLMSIYVASVYTRANVHIRLTHLRVCKCNVCHDGLRRVSFST